VNFVSAAAGLYELNCRFQVQRNKTVELSLSIAFRANCETLSRKSEMPQFDLSWLHHVLLMRIADPVERAFYEREAGRCDCLSGAGDWGGTPSLGGELPTLNKRRGLVRSAGDFS